MTHLNNEIGPGVIEIATKRIQKPGNAALRLPVQPLFVSTAHMLYFSNSAGLFHRTPYLYMCT